MELIWSILVSFPILFLEEAGMKYFVFSLLFFIISVSITYALPVPGDGIQLNKMERNIVKATNTFRDTQKLAPLRLNDSYNRLAKRIAQDMAQLDSTLRGNALHNRIYEYSSDFNLSANQNPYVNQHIEYDLDRITYRTLNAWLGQRDSHTSLINPTITHMAVGVEQGARNTLYICQILVRIPNSDEDYFLENLEVDAILNAISAIPFGWHKRYVYDQLTLFFRRIESGYTIRESPDSIMIIPCHNLQPTEYIRLNFASYEPNYFGYVSVQYFRKWGSYLQEVDALTEKYGLEPMQQASTPDRSYWITQIEDPLEDVVVETRREGLGYCTTIMMKDYIRDYLNFQEVVRDFEPTWDMNQTNRFIEQQIQQLLRPDFRLDRLHFALKR
jgi:uncharacterized protein YkwD